MAITIKVVLTRESGETTLAVRRAHRLEEFGRLIQVSNPGEEHLSYFNLLPRADARANVLR